MSEYTRNAVYTYLVNAIRAEFPSASCTSRYVPKHSAFPSVYIRELDRFRPRQYTQLDFEDNQWESAFEIQIVSNLENTASTEAYKIMEVARSAFGRLYYRQFSEATIDESSKFTVIGRFRRVIGGGDTMPTT